jgi:hypothetical protein
MRDPEWFLAKIEAGLEAAGISPDAQPPVRKLSRAEIDAIVSSALDEELERLEEVRDSGPGRRTER